AQADRLGGRDQFACPVPFGAGLLTPPRLVGMDMASRGQPAGAIHGRAGNMAMNIDAAGHDDPTGKFDRAVGFESATWLGDNAAVIDADRFHLAVDFVGGIVYTPAAEGNLHRATSAT